MGSKFVATFTFSFFFFIISQTRGVQERDLKQLNKPPIKIIFTKYGDIFDCIDIYSQPSLDHPLLQNHTLQMKPSVIPEAPSSSSSSYESANEEKYVELELEEGGCPEGSVPIRRIQEEDLIRLRTHLNKYPSSLSTNTEQNSGWHAASVHTVRNHIQVAAARGVLNVYSPSVTKEQHSDSLVYVQRGDSITLNAIQAGWTVFPAVYGDNHVRFHTMWTADNYKHTGCIDMHCFGFVQVSHNIAPGLVIAPVSQYGGKQSILPVTISQDQYSGDWWLIASTNVVVGYWPKEIFGGLSVSGDEAGWGGRTHHPIEEAAPPMGSGHKPEEGFGKCCYMAQMQIVRSGQGSFQDLTADMLLLRVDKRLGCYGVNLLMDTKDRANILFGGPGGQYCG